MNLTVWLDIGVSIFFILTVIVCYRRGFAKTILGLLSSVISLAGAYFIGSWLSKLIYDNAIKDKIVSNVSNSMESSVSSTTSKVETATNNLPEFVDKILGYFGYNSSNINKGIDSTVHTQSQNVANSVESVIGPIVTALIAFLLVFLLFIILRFITGKISKMICHGFNLPVISTVNHIVGGVVGIFNALILIYFLSGIVTYAIPLFSGGKISYEDFNLAVESSKIFKIFYEHNFLADTLKSVLSVFN